VWVVSHRSQTPPPTQFGKSKQLDKPEENSMIILITLAVLVIVSAGIGIFTDWLERNSETFVGYDDDDSPMFI
jgi:hypothetical protein